MQCFCAAHDIQGTKATPITLIAAGKLNAWVQDQDSFTKAWFKSQEGHSRSFTLVPDNSGVLARVVYELPAAQDFFIAGDLAKQLPKGVYHLDLSAFVEVSTSAESEASSRLEDIRERFQISWALGAYCFDRYLEQSEEIEAQLLIDEHSERERAQAFAEAIYLTRDLVNTPASDMMPEHLAKLMAELSDRFGGRFTQIIGDELLAQNYPTIHAVGRASSHAPRLLELNWGADDAPLITLVGKGVCFDSGGLNLKPGNAMRLMKKDMGGAAHVLGLAHLIMATNLPIRLRVLVPAVENAVSGDAFRPGDVIRTRKGLSVEIDNTDAEGRLVLCDALADADDQKPELIVDFATLTGACRVALGTELPGFFCNDDGTAHELSQAGNKVQDPVWQLPLHQPYNAMLNSKVADLVNSAPTGMGGAITAALYLQRFVSAEQNWIHFDVMAWNDRVQPGRSIGGEAFGLRATYALLAERYST